MRKTKLLPPCSNCTSGVEHTHAMSILFGDRTTFYKLDKQITKELFKTVYEVTNYGTYPRIQPVSVTAYRKNIMSYRSIRYDNCGHCRQEAPNGKFCFSEYSQLSLVHPACIPKLLMIQLQLQQKRLSKANKRIEVLTKAVNEFKTSSDLDIIESLLEQ